MRIKSLLLGSAAALVAVSGARAADAIYAEPEPVEYVRVCDVYGAGFFYIPGTETCLQISGWVRYNIDFRSDDEDGLGGDDEWRKTSAARVNFDARSDTELGTLRGYIRFQGEHTNTGNSDFPVYVDQAIIQLGGLYMAYTESAWVATAELLTGDPTGYGSHSMRGLSYGYQQRQAIGYNFGGGNGFFGTIALENDPTAVWPTDDTGSLDANFMPDVVARVGMMQDWGAISAAVGYDENSVYTDDGEFGVKVATHINMPNMPGSSLKLIGFWASGPNAYDVGAEWSVIASYYQQFTPTIGAHVGVQYLANTYAPAIDPLDFAGDDEWVAEAGVAWTPVTNFLVRAEVSHAFESEVTSGRLRFQRSF